ncbi:MAG: site-specific integrase [Ignavibacteriales bacterium]|nr:MAG: site-specific integrase [Ignavibacteriales bacterium]
MYLYKRGGIYYLAIPKGKNGKLKKISTRCKLKSDANKFLFQYKEKLNEVDKTSEISLSDFREKWLEYVKYFCSKKYYLTAKSLFKRLEKYFGNIPLKDLDVPEFEKFFMSLKQEGIKGIKTYYAIIKSALNKAIDWNYLFRNPLLKIKLPNNPRNKPLYLTEEDLDYLIMKEEDPLYRKFYFFAFHTGMRLGEITNLKWSEIDLKERIIKVINTQLFTTKNKKERIIPINEKLFNLLKSMFPKVLDITKDMYLFNKKGFMLDGNYINRRFKRALSKTDLNQSLHIHSLRHSFASKLVMNGVSLYAIMELLGHQDIKTTQIYSHLKIDSLKDAVKMLEL